MGLFTDPYNFHRNLTSNQSEYKPLDPAATLYNSLHATHACIHVEEVVSGCLKPHEEIPYQSAMQTMPLCKSPSVGVHGMQDLKHSSLSSSRLYMQTMEVMMEAYEVRFKYEKHSQVQTALAEELSILKQLYFQRTAKVAASSVEQISRRCACV